jgi:hypothetical protein
MTATTVNLKTTTDVVAWLAANVATTIASANLPGHDLDRVMARMTTDRVLAAIRTAYTTCAARGDHRPTAVKKIGVRLIAEYYRQHGLD